MHWLRRSSARSAGQLESYAQFPEWHGLADLPDVPRIADWLNRHIPASYTPGILHGDFHLGNLMMTDDSPCVAAVIDWELATIGDPLLDLGGLIAGWPDDSDATDFTLQVQPRIGFPTTDELLARYAAGSARDLSAIGMSCSPPSASPYCWRAPMRGRARGWPMSKPATACTAPRSRCCAVRAEEFDDRGHIASSCYK